MAKNNNSPSHRGTAVKTRPDTKTLAILIAGAVVLLIALIGVITLAFRRGAQEAPKPTPTPDPEATATPAPTPDPTLRPMITPEAASLAPPDTSAEISEQSVQRRDGFPMLTWDVTKFAYGPDGRMTYSGAVTRTGIDVSEHQGKIDWQRVADAGIDFAMIRVGYRGSTAGGIYIDEYFKRNITGATAVGLPVGVYFYSQAVNVEEAREEARYLLKQIEGYNVTYPVVFDWEIVGGEDARTYSVSRKMLLNCTRAFCDTVQEAGYRPMIYFTRYLAYRKYMLRNLTEYGFWYAEYEEHPRFVFDFDMWQYSETGQVDGIDGPVDLNIYAPRI